jgi:putative SOS response-associated peptidase YedK
MCGRYTLMTPAAELESRFDAAFDDPPEPRYNCAPGQSLPVVADDDPDRFQTFEWGLIPSWADDASVGNDLINARAETVEEKPSFEASFERRRCLVPADGFYEWVRDGETKQPYRVSFDDDRPFAMAGLWDRWEPTHTQTGLSDFGADSGATGDPDAIESFTIVTTEPNDVVADLHHRMAVVLNPEEESTWLHGTPKDAAELLAPYPGDDWEAYPVSTRVNSPVNDVPDLIERVEV